MPSELPMPSRRVDRNACTQTTRRELRRVRGMKPICFILAVLITAIAPRTSAAQGSTIPPPTTWEALSTQYLAGANLPSLGRDGAFCKDKPNELDDMCWETQAADLNGDGRPDIVAHWRFTGNDPELADNTLLVFLGTPGGFKSALRSKGNGGAVYTFGAPACRSLGQFEGQAQAPTHILVWECRDGHYPVMPRLIKPQDARSTAARAKEHSLEVRWCVECCTDLPVATVPHACVGWPGLRGCKVGAAIREAEANEIIAPAVVSAAEKQCPKPTRTKLCTAACESAASRSADAVQTR